ncbi:hypothetical protein [Nocardia fluminea]|uniref:hypothetical protein n=1 Tax=Nocardia fluminea TaxID=134984 RepID=UPI00364C0538
MNRLTTLAAAAIEIATIASKALMRRLASEIVARRNGPTLTAAIHNGDLVTIGAHLTTLGADTDTVRRYGSTLGKKVKAAHLALTGRTPMQVWTVGPHGYPIQVSVYSPADPSLTEGVTGYDRTAHLVNA